MKHTNGRKEAESLVQKLLERLREDPVLDRSLTEMDGWRYRALVRELVDVTDGYRRGY